MSRRNRHRKKRARQAAQARQAATKPFAETAPSIPNVSALPSGMPEGYKPRLASTPNILSLASTPAISMSELRKTRKDFSHTGRLASRAPGFIGEKIHSGVGGAFNFVAGKKGSIRRGITGGIARGISKRPGLIGALGIAGLTLGAGAQQSYSGAKQSMELNRMYVQHTSMQRQAALDTIPVGGLGRQVTPTFSGRRVRGGHMGATGDLVFAMNRNR